MIPVIIAVPSGHWGIGPSLLYVVGVLAALLYLAWQRDDDRPSDAEQRRRAMERRKDEAFTRALMQAAAERKAPQ